MLRKYKPIHFTKEDLTDNVITNYKINQPFTDVRLKCGGRREKFQSHSKSSLEPAELSTMLKPFLRRRHKSQWKENHTVATLRANSFWAGQIFFLVLFKESRFPLFGISIQAGKGSSRSITERSCATGIDFFYNAEASNFQRRP